MARPPHTGLRRGPARLDGAWRLRGACRALGDYFFFAPDGEHTDARIRREQFAKKICASCPVLEQCRDHAVTTAEPHGVWGGLSESERKRPRYRRPVSQ